MKFMKNGITYSHDPKNPFTLLPMLPRKPPTLGNQLRVGKLQPPNKLPKKPEELLSPV
jgi:hypothetical protein